MQRQQPASKAQHLIRKASASYQTGNYADAIKAARNAEKLDPKACHAYYWRGIATLQLGDVNGALDLVQEALARFPGNFDVLSLKSQVFLAMGNYQEAAEVLRACLDIRDDYVEGWVNYSAALFNLQQYSAAQDAAARAIAWSPDNVAALGNSANSLKEIGRVPEAIAALRRACGLIPAHHVNRTSLLFVLLCDEKTSATDLLIEAKSYAKVLESTATHRRVTPATSGGRIRIGLMSNDLKRHSCAYFILPFIANLDRSRFEVILFCLNRQRDDITRRLSQYAEHFIDIAGFTAIQVAQAVHKAMPDVLIDVGGYTGVSPLQFMAHRLAPIQMTWLGYPGSTGMKSIDYRISDWCGDPEGYEAHYTETLLRAPGSFCTYSPLVARPLEAYGPTYRVHETPALEAGYITFGSCNNLGKITDKTLRMWSAVLARCPRSRLLVEAIGVDNESVRDTLLARMENAGIEAQRVQFIARDSKNQYLTYNNIDIALDTAPLTGGTTTCDALWMGVPVITLAGRAFHERLTATVLHPAGLDFLICDSEAAYVETAVQLASDIARLSELRMSLRPCLEQSSMFDAASFARWFEQQTTALVQQYRTPEVVDKLSTDGIFFAGEWYSHAAIAIAITSLLENRLYDELCGLLENISAKWNKHWLVAYALAEMSYLNGDKVVSLELLIEAAGLRRYSLQLYRLLSARLDECQVEKDFLANLLQEQFGIDLAYLDQLPMPTLLEIVGIQAEAGPA